MRVKERSMTVRTLLPSPDVGLRALADFTKESRKRRLLSQRELAQLAGVSTATVNYIELAKIRPHPSTLRKLAEALEVKPEELVEHLEQLPRPRRRTTTKKKPRGR
jgi:transcriptional regulator with XRE-family HTH domain